MALPSADREAIKEFYVRRMQPFGMGWCAGVVEHQQNDESRPASALVLLSLSSRTCHWRYRLYKPEDEISTSNRFPWQLSLPTWKAPLVLRSGCNGFSIEEQERHGDNEGTVPFFVSIIQSDSAEDTLGEFGLDSSATR